MGTKLRTWVAAFAVAALAGSAGAASKSADTPNGPNGQVGSPSFKVSGLVFNSALLLNMALQANNGTVSNFNAGAAAGVLSAVVRNSGTAAGPFYFVPVISQPGQSYGCSNGTLVTGPLLQTTVSIQPGQTLMINAANVALVSGSGYNGSICSGFQTSIQNKFNNLNPGNLKDAISYFEQQQFVVCLEESAAPSSGAGLVPSDKACTSLQLIHSGGGSSIARSGAGIESASGSADASAQGISTQLISPIGGSVTALLPKFVWASSGSSAQAFQYRFNVSAVGPHRDIWTSVLLPASTYLYQYQPTDRALIPGTTYYWWVERDTVESNGSAPQDLDMAHSEAVADFVYLPGGQGAAAVVTLQQLDALV